MVKRTIGDFRRKAAKQLRANTTEAEAILWRRLRRIEVRGSHFRRQVVIGSYIADFACLAEKLVIEVDGSQHGATVGVLNDEARTRWLNSEGYRVIRFWNNDVMSKTESVMEAIYQMVATPPRLLEAGDHPPQGEGK